MIGKNPIGSFAIGSFLALANNPNIIDSTNTLVTLTLDGGLSNKLDSSVLVILSDGTLTATTPVTGNVDINLLITSVGNIITIPTIRADISVNSISMQGLVLVGKEIAAIGLLDNLLTISGSIVQSTGIQLDKPSLIVTINGDVSQSTVITLPDFEDEVITDGSITGNNYIVVNLRTRSHTTYRDGNNNAYAKTGKMSFGSIKNKNVSDAFVFGRSDKAIELVILNDEITERAYEITYQENEQGNLKNKKCKLSKGLTGTNWEVAIRNKEAGFTEVRAIDLFVSELKRHV